jgi:hypothetical protein
VAPFPPILGGSKAAWVSILSVKFMLIDQLYPGF